MVAKIKSGKSLIGALNYNERKVGKGKALLIAASLYPKESLSLTFEDKLFRLTDLAGRNPRVKTNTVHLSLNFDVSEKMVADQLCSIADRYMDKIGFGAQPYLVYQHFDTGHDHIHILTTNIQADGSRISLHDLGRLKSEPARKAVEQEFGLVRAGSKAMSVAAEQEIRPLVYGATDTKRALSDIVGHVARSYKFTSLPEFNAVLRFFNVMADRGSKEAVMFKNKGLRYWALDENGKKSGVPIKASALLKKPTLKLLEERFRLNEFLRKPYRSDLAARIDRVLSQVRTRQDLQAALKSVNIHVLLRQNEEGRLYGLTFVDTQNKVVFNGSDLGKSYSAAAIGSRLLNNAKTTGTDRMIAPAERMIVQDRLDRTTEAGLINDLLSPIDQTGEQNQFERKKKKKRKRLRI